MLRFPKRRCHVGLQPLVITLTYFSLLPRPSPISKEDEEDDNVVPFTEYYPLPTDDGETTGYSGHHDHDTVDSGQFFR